MFVKAVDKIVHLCYNVIITTTEKVTESYSPFYGKYRFYAPDEEVNIYYIYGKSHVSLL